MHIVGFTEQLFPIGHFPTYSIFYCQQYFTGNRLFARCSHLLFNYKLISYHNNIRNRQKDVCRMFTKNMLIQLFYNFISFTKKCYYENARHTSVSRFRNQSLSNRNRILIPTKWLYSSTNSAHIFRYWEYYLMIDDWLLMKWTVERIILLSQKT
jgi:hypothetical protein